MISARLSGSGVIRILIIFLTALQMVACNLDEVADGAPGGVVPVVAVISGIDSGSITEDADYDSNNLLEVSGQLNIIDSDPGEAAFIAKTVNGSYGSLVIDAAGNWYYAAANNQSAIQGLVSGGVLTDVLPVSSIDGTLYNVTIVITGVDDAAIISGIDTGSITEDVDHDSDNLLETSGQLSITDSDSGEAAFIAKTVNGSYGSLVIDAAGNWYYAAANNQPAIQYLAKGAELTDIFSVSSVDGTMHDVTIVITGVDETVVLSWVAPVAREDDKSLSLSEIEGYMVYYGTTSGQYSSSVNIKDSSAQSYTFTNLAVGDYYFAVTAYDDSGRESQHSSEVNVTVLF